MKHNNITKILGFIFLSVAVFCWIATPILPFINISSKLAIIGVVVVTGEICFISAVFFLGKEYWGKIRAWGKRIFKREKKSKQ